MSLTFDLSRAFDAVNIEFIITKLYNKYTRRTTSVDKILQSNRKLLDTILDV